MNLTSRYGPAAALVVLALTASACSAGSGSTPSPATTSAGSPPSAASTDKAVPIEKNPPGDIPDNLAFVTYSNRAGGYTFTHPEGWAQTTSGAKVQFTDKLNGVNVDSMSASKTPTVASAKSTDIPRLNKSVPAFELRKISAITLPGGAGVRIVFRRNSEPDTVTGKIYRDEVEEYLILKSGRLVRMDLYGPVGADNVDAYRTMSQSISIR